MEKMAPETKSKANGKPLALIVPLGIESREAIFHIHDGKSYLDYYFGSLVQLLYIVVVSLDPNNGHAVMIKITMKWSGMHNSHFSNLLYMSTASCVYFFHW